MPIRKPWDHGIDLKQDFQPKKGRLIPLSVDKQKEVEVFLDDQLAKGYIRPSISPQTSPVFFVPKKDGKKRCRACSTAERTATNIVIAPIARAHRAAPHTPAPCSCSCSLLPAPAPARTAPCSHCSLSRCPLLTHAPFAPAPCSCSHCSLLTMLALVLVLPSLAAPFRL